MIYLDSSALLKVVRVEAETEALVDWLARHPDLPTVTSELGRVEVLRAARRAGPAAFAEAGVVLADLDMVPIDRSVQDRAAQIGEPALRTLDAIHLASAVALGEALTWFVAYDHRLAEAATAAGLSVVSPAPTTSDHDSPLGPEAS